MTEGTTPRPKVSDLTIDDVSRQSPVTRRWLPIVLAVAVLIAAVLIVVALSGPGAIDVAAATARPAADGAAATVLNASGYVEPRRRATVAAKTTVRVT